jgi:DNA-binding transcriptional MerR regulator
MVIEQEPATVAGLTVAAVARRMGVAPATLRTWDRRYGVGPGEHAAGTHRRYSPDDIARLEHMRRLVIAGVPPADAARAARELDPSEIVVPAPGQRAGGGHVVAHPGATPAERGLARAAQALDTAACESIIGESLNRRGVIWTWDRLLVPVLSAVGERWQNTGRGVEIEHALSSAVQASLLGTIRVLINPVNSRTVLLACAPGEMHTLPLWALAAALAERRISSRVLGTGLPADALVDAVERLGPAAVFVWAQIPGTADRSILAALPSFRPRSTVLAGGPGWTGDAPADVSGTADLADTVARIAHAVGE